MVSKTEMKKMIVEKKKEVQIARAYFNQCSQDDFELANMKLTVAIKELSKLIAEYKLQYGALAQQVRAYRLITGWSRVQVPDAPPLRCKTPKVERSQTRNEKRRTE